MVVKMTAAFGKVSHRGATDKANKKYLNCMFLSCHIRI